jgi:hypothetical protein
MKTGIITYHRALNYGAVIQAFALKTALENLGADASIIDYRNSKIESLYKKKSFCSEKGLKNKLKFILTNKNDSVTFNKFCNFRRDFLGLTKEDSAVYKKDLKLLNDKYDKFIVGSDQVWNANGHDFDTAYLLDFVSDNAKKYSYSASFGKTEIEDEFKDRYKELLNTFSAISVREEQGREIVTKLIDKDARVDLDPVFLLSKSEWNKIFSLKSDSAQKYVVMYNFELTKTQIELALKFKKLGYKVKYIGNPVKKMLPFECEYQRSAGPIDFLKLIYNASAVITNSFHGLSLSLNFNVPVFLELLTDMKEVNSRFISLINLLGVQDVVATNSINLTKMLNYNYDSVNEKIKKLRELSLNYLKEITK